MREFAVEVVGLLRVVSAELAELGSFFFFWDQREIHQDVELRGVHGCVGERGGDSEV